MTDFHEDTLRLRGGSSVSLGALSDPAAGLAARYHLREKRSHSRRLGKTVTLLVRPRVAPVFPGKSACAARHVLGRGRVMGTWSPPSGVGCWGLAVTSARLDKRTAQGGGFIFFLLERELGFRWDRRSPGCLERPCCPRPPVLQSE